MNLDACDPCFAYRLLHLAACATRWDRQTLCFWHWAPPDGNAQKSPDAANEQRPFGCLQRAAHQTTPASDVSFCARCGTRVFSSIAQGGIDPPWPEPDAEYSSTKIRAERSWPTCRCPL